MKKVLCVILALTLCLACIPCSVYAETAVLKAAKTDVFSSECGSDQCLVYIYEDCLYMDIEDIARYTRSEYTVNMETLKVTHGTRVIEIDLESHTLAEDTYTTEINTLRNGQSVVVHAFPMLAYLGATCSIEGEQLVIYMPECTVWEGLVPTGYEDEYTLDTFGSAANRRLILLLNGLLSVFESGLAETLTISKKKEAIVLAAQIDPLNETGAVNQKGEIDIKHATIFSNWVAAYHGSLGDAIKSADKAKPITNTAMAFLNNRFANNNTYSKFSDAAGALGGVSDFYYITMKAYTSYMACTKDTVYVLNAWSKHISKNSDFGNAMSDTMDAVEGGIAEETELLVEAAALNFAETLDSNVSTIAKSFSSVQEWASVSKKVESAANIVGQVKLSVDISVMVNKWLNNQIFGKDPFERASAQTRAINLLYLKNDLFEARQSLGEKILKEHYANEGDIEDYRLLTVFYYKTLLALYDQLELIVTNSNGLNETEVTDALNSLHRSSYRFAQQLYILTMATSAAIPSIEDLSKGNEWDGGDYLETLKNQPVQWVVDAVNFEKDIIVIPPYAGFWEPGSMKHQIKIPELTLNTASAQTFNQKIYDTHSYGYQLLLSNQEYSQIFDLDYEYKVYNGVVAIAVIDGCFAQAGGGSFSYEVYYYDLNADRELTLDEYLAAVGIQYSAVVSKIMETDAYKEATQYSWVPVVDMTACLLDENGTSAFFVDEGTMDGWSVFRVQSVLDGD